MKIKIDQLLKKQGKTRYWLSEQTGITYPNIRNLCTNQTSSIKFDVIQKICTALNCDISDILEIDLKPLVTFEGGDNTKI